MDALNITRADAYPRATGVIPTIIEITQGLIAKGYAYEIEGDVYFRGPQSRRLWQTRASFARRNGSGRADPSGRTQRRPDGFRVVESIQARRTAWDSPWVKGARLAYRVLGDELCGAWSAD